MPDNNNNPQVNQPHNTDRSPQDYARQQEDIRANQTYGENSLEKVSDRENQRNIGLDDEIAPKNQKGYDIAPTAVNVKP